MSSDAEYDVAVIGAGPAGTSCGILLAEAGLRVVIVDKARFPRRKICGDCINPACWLLFERLGVSGAVVKKNPNHIDRIRVASRRGSIVDYELPRQRHPFTALKRSELDTVLLNRASHIGCVVLQETGFSGVEFNGRWDIILDDRRILKASFLVGADGRNSTVASRLGVRRRPSRHRAGWVGLQWNISIPERACKSVDLYLLDRGYFGFVAHDRDSANVAMVVSGDCVRLFRTDFSQFLAETILQNRVAVLDMPDPTPASSVVTCVPIEPMQRILKHPFAFLIGDAKQTVEPFTGEGVYFALLDGMKTAIAIGQRYGLKMALDPSQKRRPFWPNRVFSPLLRSPVLADFLVIRGARYPFLVPPVMRRIMGKKAA